MTWSWGKLKVAEVIEKSKEATVKYIHQRELYWPCLLLRILKLNCKLIITNSTCIFNATHCWEQCNHTFLILTPPLDSNTLLKYVLYYSSLGRKKHPQFCFRKYNSYPNTSQAYTVHCIPFTLKGVFDTV